MEDETELLKMIRQKETELAKTINAAREAAATRIAAAETEATRIRENASRESVVEGDAMKKDGMAALKEEKEKIIRDGESERDRLRAGSESRIPAAAERICRTITLR